MDFARFKNFIRQHNDKLILFEQGEPEIVMMSFREYERLLSRGVGNEGGGIAARDWNDSVIPGQEVSDFAGEDEPSRDADWPTEANAVSQAAHAFPHAITNPASSRTPIRLEDVQLEDLPIEGF